MSRVAVIIRFPSREVVRAASAVLLLLLGVYLLWRTQDVRFLMFLAILLAAAIEPIVIRLRREPLAAWTVHVRHGRPGRLLHA